MFLKPLYFFRNLLIIIVVAVSAFTLVVIASTGDDTVKCIARYLELNGVTEKLMGNKAKEAVAASVDCNALIDDKLLKAHWKRGNETIKSTTYVQYQSCLIRRMRLDDRVRTTYLQKEEE